jgi:hypothetical protein
MNKTVLAFTLAATTTLAGNALAEGERLTGDALVSSISGKTFSGRTNRGGTWESTYAAGGKMDVRVLDSDWSDSGTWEIKDDRLCSERSRRSYMCYELMRVSGDEYHWVDERGQTTKSSGPR